MMDVEKFAELFEEFLEYRSLLMEMEKDLHCKTTDNVLFLEEKDVLRFAKIKDLIPTIKEDDTTDECCRYRIVFVYKKAELVAYLSQKDYLLYQKEGLLP